MIQQVQSYLEHERRVLVLLMIQRVQSYLEHERRVLVLLMIQQVQSYLEHERYSGCNLTWSMSVGY